MKITPNPDCPTLSSCSLENFNYQIDPYMGCEHNCYYCYVLPNARTNWTREILVHPDLLDRLFHELSAIQPQTIYMGWHTDPYQPAEEKHGYTRKILKLLMEKGFSASILTKSDLVLRDMDILKKMENPSVSISFAFNDNRDRRIFEGCTKSFQTRFNALKTLKENKIRTTVMICPVIPYITNAPSLVKLLWPESEHIWIYGLSILDRSHKNGRNVQKILQNHFPKTQAKIEAAIFSREDPFWKALRQELELCKVRENMSLDIHI
ncbi:MAG: radical SAM protein [Desulfobacteraceae bacterium]|nr:radical SAM protein [Desulfobacteraceae bacterium]